MSENRNQSLKKSIFSGFAGKGISAFTQLAAIPAVITGLGVEKFGIYLMLVPFFIWIIAVASVLGNALSVKLADANAFKLHKKQNEYFSSAFFPLFFFCLGISILIFVSTNQLDFIKILNLENYSYEKEIRDSILILSVLVPLNVFLTISESAHTGLQKQFVNNVLTAIANIFIILSLVIVIKFPSIPNMVLAMFLPLTIFKFINLIYLIKKYSYMIPRSSNFKKSYLLELLNTGSGFALMQIGALGYQQFPIFYIGQIFGPSYAAILGVLLQLNHNFTSIITIVTQPLLPAIADAYANNDYFWIRNSYRAFIKRVLPFLIIFMIIINIFGINIAELLMRQDLSFEQLVTVVWSLYFLIAIWEHCCYVYIAGMGKIWNAAILYVIGSIVSIFFCMIFISKYTLYGAFLGMIIGPVIITIFSYPYLITRLIKN